jgi:hypothetical protein
VKALKTVAAANVRHPASPLAKQAAVLLTSSANQKKANNLQKRSAALTAAFFMQNFARKIYDSPV